MAVTPDVNRDVTGGPDEAVAQALAGTFRLEYFICDVFASGPFSGNALPVFVGAASLTPGTMQLLAAEMGLSESIFVLWPRRSPYEVRIFTPTTELDFAGHPTLGAAALLALHEQSRQITLSTKKGHLSAEFELTGPGVAAGWIQQPTPVVTALDSGLQKRVVLAIGVQASTLTVVGYDNGVRHACVTLEHADEVARLTPNFTELRALPFQTVVVTAPDEAFWKVRVFAPNIGIDEDPGTGSAAGALALHLVRHDRLRLGQIVEFRQGAELGRPSTLKARVHGSACGAASLVEVGGEVRVVARGVFGLGPECLGESE